MKTNESNETTVKVISIQIMTPTDDKNKNLRRSKENKYLKLALSAELKFTLHQFQNRNGPFLHEFRVCKTQKITTFMKLY